MSDNIEIRVAEPSDYSQLADVMYDAVRNGKSAYSESQRQAWVPSPRSGAQWTERLESQTIFLALEQTKVLGFISLAADGYIDLAFIRPSAQGNGLFRRLYDRLETTARESGEIRLWVHSSLTAFPAFSSVGFQVSKEESVEMGGLSFDRYEMTKDLG